MLQKGRILCDPGDLRRTEVTFKDCTSIEKVCIRVYIYTYIYRLVGAIPIVAAGFQCAAQSTLTPNKYGLSKGYLADDCS